MLRTQKLHTKLAVVYREAFLALADSFSKSPSSDTIPDLSPPPIRLHPGWGQKKIVPENTNFVKNRGNEKIINCVYLYEGKNTYFMFCLNPATGWTPSVDLGLVIQFHYPYLIC